MGRRNDREGGARAKEEKEKAMPWKRRSALDEESSPWASSMVRSGIGIIYNSRRKLSRVEPMQKSAVSKSRDHRSLPFLPAVDHVRLMNFCLLDRKGSPIHSRSIYIFRRSSLATLIAARDRCWSGDQ